MCFDVIFKSACLWTRIIALWAFVWFLPIVVFSQTKWITSFWTFVYFLPSVGDDVALQFSWLTKWLTTFWTIVVLHSTMGEHMLFQRARHTKWLLHSTHLYGWTEYLSSMPAPEDAIIVCDICACRGKGGCIFHHLNMGRSFIPIVEVWCNK